VKALLVDHASMETAKLDVDIPQIDITIAPDNGIENIKIAEIWCNCARTALLRLPVAKTGKLKSAACRSIRARSKTHCAAVATLRRLRWSPATMTRVSLRLLPTWFRSDRLPRPSSQISRQQLPVNCPDILIRHTFTSLARFLCCRISSRTSPHLKRWRRLSKTKRVGRHSARRPMTASVSFLQFGKRF